MKKTKIVSTIGPSTNSKQKIDELIDEGVDVFRQNFSHVDHESHGEIFDRIRETSEKTAVMIDTKGPEIRLGEVKEETFLKKGHDLVLTTEKITGDSKRISVNYDDLPDYLESGDEIRIDDGKIELEIESVEEDEIYSIVIFGGEISTRKALNVPGKDIGLTAPTDKDVEDIKFAAKKGYDFLSLSFVKQASDVEKVRDILDQQDSDMHIISKIEHRKAVENFDEILEASDAIMVARGDLGVEMPPAKLPKLQKDMIEKCNLAGKPVITATQMLESMTENPTATRAEISDVGNAVLDGTDAVMLSGETAIGDYPVKTVKLMSEIVREVETSMNGDIHHTVKKRPKTTRDIICKNVWQASRDKEADYIVAHTTSGSTARNISKYRPNSPVIGFTDTEITERQLQLVWGVEPYYQKTFETVDDMIRSSAERLEALNLVENEDILVLSAGIPASVTGTTNMMQIREVGEILEN
ncbi:MAG: pyruvate kinase [Candidatus Nanohaloarchaea archaeon]